MHIAGARRIINAPGGRWGDIKNDLTIIKLGVCGARQWGKVTYTHLDSTLKKAYDPHSDASRARAVYFSQLMRMRAVSATKIEHFRCTIILH